MPQLAPYLRIIFSLKSSENKNTRLFIMNGLPFPLWVCSACL